MKIVLSLTVYILFLLPPIIFSDVGREPFQDNGFAPKLNAKRTQESIEETFNVYSNPSPVLDIYYTDTEGDQASECEVLNVTPNQVRFVNANRPCECVRSKCRLTGLSYPNKFSGLVTLEVRFKDKAGWGESDEVQVSVPLNTKNFTTEVLYWAAIILIGIATFVIARVIFTEEAEYKAGEALDEIKSKADTKKLGAIFRVSRPFYKRYFLGAVKGLKAAKKSREEYKRKIASAGLLDELTVEDFWAFKLFLIIGFPVAFLFLRWFLEAEWALSYVPIVSLIGFYYPNIWIKSRIEQRQKNVVSEMPFIVDMLALCVESSLETQAAIVRVVDKARPGPLREEFEMLLKEIKVGASRSEALRNLAWRVNLIQVSSFCATLIAADAVGAPIPPILKALSAEMRVTRSAMIEKAGAKAATKLLFPTMAFIVPAIFVVIFAPIALQVFGSL